MENASKALIIAGEVLIAILVITFMVSLFVAFSNFSSNMHEKLSNEQVIRFNNNFNLYDGRTNITAQEIVTTINFAKQSNDARELEYSNRTSSDYYTTVLIDGMDVFNSSTFVNNQNKYNNELQQILNQFLNANNTRYPSYKNNVVYFSCNVSNIKRVGDEVKFEYVTRNESDPNNDIHVNPTTGLIDKIHFHTVDPSVTNITNK